jgi:hypothetical protein
VVSLHTPPPLPSENVTCGGRFQADVYDCPMQCNPAQNVCGHSNLRIVWWIILQADGPGELFADNIMLFQILKCVEAGLSAASCLSAGCRR